MVSRGRGCPHETLRGAIDPREGARATVPRDRAAVFQLEFVGDPKSWLTTKRCAALRALDLVQAVRHDPFSGIGKPQPLKCPPAVRGRVV